MREPVRGEASSVPLPSFTDKRPALFIHTHGDTDTPFSPGDLSTLFVPPSENKGVPVLLLATPSLKMLICRTRGTPFLSPRELWDTIGMMHHDYDMTEESELHELQYDSSDAKDSDFEPPITEDYKTALRKLSDKRMFVLTRVAHDFNLKIYSCLLKDNIASVAS